MENCKFPNDLRWTMKTAVRALTLSLSLFLAGCYQDRAPYTTVDETSNPPRAQSVFTNPVVVTPTGERTNSRVYPGDPAQTNRGSGANR